MHEALRKKLKKTPGAKTTTGDPHMARLASRRVALDNC